MATRRCAWRLSRTWTRPWSTSPSTAPPTRSSSSPRTRRRRASSSRRWTRRASSTTRAPASPTASASASGARLGSARAGYTRAGPWALRVSSPPAGSCGPRPRTATPRKTSARAAAPGCTSRCLSPSEPHRRDSPPASRALGIGGVPPAHCVLALLARQEAGQTSQPSPAGAEWTRPPRLAAFGNGRAGMESSRPRPFFRPVQPGRGATPLSGGYELSHSGALALGLQAQGQPIHMMTTY
mmetsp:Transcript_10242/g.34802  ORF Transcript_10242/g.34802 Transcript_10242/m.34802 type:complete len:240 (-) Transcript_10242:83-802(-)